MADTESLENISSLLNMSDTLEAVGGVLLDGDFNEKNFCFTSVATDSRKVVKNTLFVPLIGEFQDGHSYVPQAVGAGASAVFISKYEDKKTLDELRTLAHNHKNVAFILVENTLYALQKAAEAYALKFPGLVRCAITGSSGKTTTKEIAASVLSQKFSVVATEGNFNSETGLPLSVFRIRKNHELGLFEMGMNRKNEIKEIAQVFKPEFAIITNIGTAHIGILGSRENIAAEKKNVFNFIDEKGAAFIPENDDFKDFLSKDAKGEVIFYGEKSDKNVKFLRDEGLDGTIFEVDGLEVRLALPGHYNFLNALGAVALAKKLGLTAQEIKRGIETLKPLGGRSEILHGKYTVLKDCYNANPDSMEKAVELCSSVKKTNPDQKKIFVLGDMLELGEKSKSEHEKIGSLAVKSGADIVIFAGDEMKAAYEKAAQEEKASHSAFESTEESNVSCNNENFSVSSVSSVRNFFYVSGHSNESIQEIVQIINQNVTEGDLILLKGSRGMGLERVIPYIENSSVDSVDSVRNLNGGEK